MRSSTLSLKIIFKTINAYLRTKLGRFVTPYRYEELFRIVEETKARNIMEIGTYKGKRGFEMIERAKKFNDPQSINYFGFDLFEPTAEAQNSAKAAKEPLTLEKTKESLGRTGANINLFKGNTLKTLPETLGKLPKMDVIFIDGGHTYEVINNDWLYSEKLMHDKSVVVFDDCWLNRDDGALLVVSKIDRSKFKIEMLPTIDVFFYQDKFHLVIQLAKVIRK